MSAPRVERDGDTFIVLWDDQQVGIGLQRFTESRDGLKAEITIESTAPGFDGHIHGPAHLNLLSTESQNRLAKVLGERVNHMDWGVMLSGACALVADLWRRPEPIVDLSVRVAAQRVEYLLPGVPVDETTLFYGDGESAKSLLCLLIALSARTGVVLPWAAHVEKPLEVMVCDWETNEHTVRSRWHRICAGYGLTEIPRLYYRAMRHPLHEELPELLVARDKLGIGMFVLDSLSYACDGSLIEDQPTRAMMNSARALSPATRLGIAHVSQETAKASSGQARPFGSAFFWNSMRSGWEVRRAEDAPAETLELGLYHRKNNDGPKERPAAVRVRFDGNEGPIGFSRGDLAASPDLLGRTPLVVRVRTALRGGARDTKDLAEECGVAESTIRGVVRRMADVIQVAPGGGGGANARAAQWGLRDA